MIRYFASHKTAANLLMVAFIIVGLAMAPTVKRETFPDIPPRNVEITAAYPGATAKETENAICLRIETAMDGINEVREVRCEATEGLGTATVEMIYGGNFDRFFNDIRTAVDAIDSFPEQVERPVIRQLGQTDFVVAVSVSGAMSPPDLKAYAEQMKKRMMQQKAISQVLIRGYANHQIRIEISALSLHRYGLSVSDIADVITRQNVNLPAGSLETTARDILIRFGDERRSVDEFKNMIVIAGESGAEIRLGDIATITDRFRDKEKKTVVNGQRAITMSITKTKAEDTLDVVDAVSKFIENERKRAPPGVAFTLTENISSIVRDRLDMLVRNGLQGLGLVFLTMWLFFSFRFSFWVAMGLPVSFLGTIFMMSLTGYSFDMISMVGLLIAVGLLMDDAIVISENIATHINKGMPPLEAAIHGTKQVAPGVIASFITTICIFGSLIFLKGNIGAIIKVLPIILIVTLSVSLIEAFFILPHHLANSRHASKPLSGFRKGFEEKLDWFRESVLGRLVDIAVEWRYLTIGLITFLLLLSLSIVAGGGIKFIAFPKLDGDIIEARILLPQGTPLKRTEAVVKLVTDALQRVNLELSPKQPGRQSLVKNVNVHYSINKDAHESGTHVATVSVDLIKAEIRNSRLDYLLNKWRLETGKISDVININFVEFEHGPAGRAIDIRMRGSSLDELKAVSIQLQDWLKQYRGVFDVSDDLRPGKPEIKIRLRDGAKVLGLDALNIATQLRSAFNGKTADEIQVDTEAIKIDVKMAEADRNSIADLEYFTVTTAEGRQVPLRTVATIEHNRGYARILRVDGLRTVTVQGDIDTSLANAAEIINDSRNKFFAKLKQTHPGIRVSFQGQAKEGGTTGTSMRKGFLLGLVGVFMLLSFQFKSYAEPVVVMAAIPLGLIGVIWGHLAMGLDLSMPSMIGLASLSGVVVNDSILLVHFIKISRRQGLSVAEASKKASRERFRAVLLTSLTTIMGLSPLLLEQSLQAQVLKPLVTSLGFGLAGATALILLAVPVLYTILDDFGLCAKIERQDDKTS